MALVSMARPSASIRSLAAGYFLSRHAGDQKVLPDREPQIAVAEVARDFGKAAHLRDRQAPDRHHDTDPVQPVLLLRMNADMRGAVERRTRRHGAGHRAVEPAAEFLLEQTEEFLDAHGVEHVFQPRLGAVGAIAVIDEDAHHRVRHLAGILRQHQHTGIAGEIAVAGDAAEAELEPDAGSEAEAIVHLHRLEADVVGILQHRNGAGAVESDIELARQAVERAVVEDVEVPFARIGARVDQLLRIDACRRRAGDVADIVGAGAARAQPQILDRLDHGDRVVRPRLRGSGDWRASSHGRSRRRSARRDRQRRRTARP